MSEIFSRQWCLTWKIVDTLFSLIKQVQKYFDFYIYNDFEKDRVEQTALTSHRTNCSNSKTNLSTADYDQLLQQDQRLEDVSEDSVVAQASEDHVHDLRHQGYVVRQDWDNKGLSLQ